MGEGGGGGGGVTKCEMTYTHTKYAPKFEVSSITFLRMSGFLADEVLRKATGDGLSSCSRSQHLLLQCSSQ